MVNGIGSRKSYYAEFLNGLEGASFLSLSALFVTFCWFLDYFMRLLRKSQTMLCRLCWLSIFQCWKYISIRGPSNKCQMLCWNSRKPPISFDYIAFTGYVCRRGYLLQPRLEAVRRVLQTFRLLISYVTNGREVQIDST